MGIKASKARKILVIRGMGIGDIIPGIPFLRNLRKAYPKAEICILKYNGSGEPLIENCPYIDRAIISREMYGNMLEKFKFISRMRREKFDLVIDCFPSTFKTALLTTFLKGMGKSAGYKNNALSWLYNISVVPDKKKKMVYIESKLMEALGQDISRYDYRLELFLKPDYRKVDEVFRKAGISKKDFVVCIAAGRDWDESRTWPAEKWAAVCEQLVKARSAKIIITGSGSDVKRAQDIEKKIIARLGKKREGSVLNLTDKLRLEEAYGLLKRSSMLICVNCGLMHLASTIQLPTVAISGPSGYFWDPYNKNAESVRLWGLECMPCEKWFCKYKDKERRYKCMRGITPEEVVRKAEKLTAKK